MKDELANKKPKQKKEKASFGLAFEKEFSFGSKQELQNLLEKQLDGRNYVPLNDQKSVHLIPGMNLDDGVLCGTNCYAIGRGQKRILVDACKYNAE